MSGERERLTVEQSLHDENIRLKLALADVEQALAEARAVVAAQREALQRIATAENHKEWHPSFWRWAREVARAALDAEGVSEPGRVDQIATGKTTGAPASPGSLTSPVDTAPPAECACGWPKRECARRAYGESPGALEWCAEDQKAAVAS